VFNNRIVSQQDVHKVAHGVLRKCLKPVDYGRTCPADRLLSLLLVSACAARSVSTSCRLLAKAPSDETVRQALSANLRCWKELERQLNGGLTDLIPKELRKRRWPVAIDFCAYPYYGQPQEAGQVLRGPSQQGTTKFHTYASAFVVRKGQRFTLAATPVRAEDSLVDVLKRLLRGVGKAGVKVRQLLLDREFYEADVIRYLQRARKPFLMPVKLRGRSPKDPAASQSAYQFTAWKRSGWSEYSWTDQTGRKATVKICVSVRQYEHRGKRKKQRLLFAYWGFRPSSPVQVRQLYRKRFGIETSHRQLNQALIPTTTQDPRRRLLYFVLALIVRNVWAWLHWVHLAEHGKVDPNKLPFIDMLAAIASFIDVLYKFETILGLEKPAQGFP
jgi:hypothetical protein